VLVRGLGGSPCDPSSNQKTCLNERHCVACELFGCTGWTRKFRFDVRTEQGAVITSKLTKGTKFHLCFTPLRAVKPEDPHHGPDRRASAPRRIRSRAAIHRRPRRCLRRSTCRDHRRHFMRGYSAKSPAPRLALPRRIELSREDGVEEGLGRLGHIVESEPRQLVVAGHRCVGCRPSAERLGYLCG
jgi:hypothetical protein